jgi:hypothetical protein
MVYGIQIEMMKNGIKFSKKTLFWTAFGSSHNYFQSQSQDYRLPRKNLILLLRNIEVIEKQAAIAQIKSLFCDPISLD